MKELCFVTKFDNIDELVFVYRQWNGKTLRIRCIQFSWPFSTCC